MKGLFIPGITAEMFRNGCLESVETLMAEGEIYDIEYSRWIPCSERLPEMPFGCIVTVEEDDRNGEPQNVLYSEPVGYDGETWNRADGEPISFEVVAWMPLPEPYKAESEE